MADNWKWLVDDLRKASPDDDLALATLCQSAAEAIERLAETVAHLEENWEWLQKAPEVPTENVAASFVENERMTNRLNLEEHQLRGMRVRVQSVIDRARVDGALAERKRQRPSMSAEDGTPQGTIITCTNGHPMGVTVRDVAFGEINTWGNAFKWDDDKRDSMGYPICNTCGAMPKFPVPQSSSVTT